MTASESEFAARIWQATGSLKLDERITPEATIEFFNGEASGRKDS